MQLTQTTEHLDILVTRDGQLDEEYLENSLRQQRIEALKGFLGHSAMFILKAPILAATALYEAMEQDMHSSSVVDN